MPRFSVWHASLLYMIFLTPVCDMTHIYVWLDSLLCVTCLNSLCFMPHSYTWYASLLFVTWLTPMWDMTLFYVWRSGYTPHSSVWHVSLTYCSIRLILDLWVFCTVSWEISKNCSEKLDRKIFRNYFFPFHTLLGLLQRYLIKFHS